jgi:hypothetical protein
MSTVGEPYLRRSYPGLSDPESRLLRGYLEDTGTGDIRRLRTQVRVGEGEILPQISEPFRSLANDLSRLKIDAVIDRPEDTEIVRPEDTEIVELKSRLRTGFAGQLVGYANLLSRRADERSNPTLIGVAFREHVDTADALEGTGIQLHTVPRADRTTASLTPSNSPLGDDS